MSIRSLVGEYVEGSEDEDLARMFRQARELSPNDRALLDDMVQALLRRRRGDNAS